MEKRKSMPFFAKAPFSYYKNAAIGHSAKPEKLKALANRNSNKKNKVTKKYSSTNRKIKKAAALPDSIAAVPIESKKSFGSQGQMLDSMIDELGLLDELGLVDEQQAVIEGSKRTRGVKK